MGMFKPDFFRFFSIGFVVGAGLVLASLTGGHVGSEIAQGVVPAAEAAPAQ